MNEWRYGGNNEWKWLSEQIISKKEWMNKWMYEWIDK